jgi:hypothetical protein
VALRIASRINGTGRSEMAADGFEKPALAKLLTVSIVGLGDAVRIDATRDLHVARGRFPLFK